MPDLKKMLTLEALSEALPSWLKRSTKPEYNADEIDSTLTTNQFVSASDKDNWNAKGTYSKPSGGIPKSDLSSIVQTSLEKADSALQSETDPTVPTWAKQSSKPSYTQDEVPDGSTYKRVSQSEKDAWSGKQNALTTTQMQAVNSGITSAGVAQISVNQSNITLLEQMNGAKNLLQLTGTVYNPNTIIVHWDHANGTVRITGTEPVTDNVYISLGTFIADETDTYYLYAENASSSSIMVYDDGNWNTYTGWPGRSPIATIAKGTTKVLYLRIAQGTIVGDVTVKPMICKKEEWDAFPAFKPYALPNTVITPALIEQVDNGAKNVIDVSKYTNLDNITISNSVFTTLGDTLTYLRFDAWLRNGSTQLLRAVDAQYIYSNGVYHWEFSAPANVNNILIGHNGSAYNGRATISLSLISGQRYVLRVNVTQCSSSIGQFKWTDVMICTLADWKVSQKYVPHSMSYQDLSDKKLDRLRSASDGGLISSGDLNSITVNSFALYTNAVSNLPETAAGSGYCFVRTSIFDSNAALQEAIMLQTGSMYTRTKYANTWGEWKKATNS